MPKTLKFKLTERELYLAVAFAIIGFILSLREIILFLNSLNPLEGLAVYYIILYASLYFLSRLGLTIFGIKIDKPLQVLGLGLITFAFFILVNWENAYVYITVNGGLDDVPQLYFASEDGAIWFLWYNVVGIKNVEIARLLTFVLTPFLLALGGGFLLEHRVILDDEFNWKFWNRKKK
jgi:hypothetical protein